MLGTAVSDGVAFDWRPRDGLWWPALPWPGPRVLNEEVNWTDFLRLIPGRRGVVATGACTVVLLLELEVPPAIWSF